MALGLIPLAVSAIALVALVVGHRRASAYQDALVARLLGADAKLSRLTVDRDQAVADARRMAAALSTLRRDAAAALELVETELPGGPLRATLVSLLEGPP